VLNPKDVATREAGERLHHALAEEGIDVVLDDRDERPGVKFKDAELVGIPYRLTVGPRGLKDGKVELTRRRDGQTREVDIGKAADIAANAILEERR
jgi:prolyl-tRNA synthetase